MLIGFNDLGTTNPEMASELVNRSMATLVTAGSHKTTDWQCSEGHTWPAQIKSRVQGRGCPECATHGFDVGAPSLLYLLVHPDLNLFKVGIANVGSGRIGLFRAKGWQCVHTRGFRFGRDARSVEKALLATLRAKTALEEQEITSIAGHERLSGFTEMFGTHAAAWLPIELAFLVRSALGGDKHRQTGTK